jgi:probable HAF family extracellular repeat protein
VRQLTPPVVSIATPLVLAACADAPTRPNAPRDAPTATLKREDARAAFAIRVTDLGVLRGGTSSEANAINDSGDVVGAGTTARGATHAVLWRAAGGRPRDIGTLRGRRDSRARDVNRRGDVVGFSGNFTADCGGSTGGFARCPAHAFLWKSGRGMRDLGVLPGGTQSIATGLNDAEVVVGTSDRRQSDGSLIYSGFRWTVRGGMRVLLERGNVSVPTLAADINKWGQVLGTAQDPEYPNDSWAVRWSRTGAVEVEPDWGEFSVYYVSGNGINDRGDLVGSGIETNTYFEVPVLWTRERSSEVLPPVDPVANPYAWGQAFAINYTRQVVGADGFSRHAFVWTRATRTVDLGALPGFDTSEARDINNRGQVVGVSCNANTNICRATLWTIRQRTP